MEQQDTKRFNENDRVLVKTGTFMGEYGRVLSSDHPSGLVPVRLEERSDYSYNWFGPDNLDLVSGTDQRYPEYCSLCAGRCVDESTELRVVSPREDLLEEAKQLITGDRNNTYGPPTQDFTRASEAAAAYGYGKKDQEGNWTPLESHDIAVLVMLIKLSRLMWTPGKRDSWTDIAGYAGCGFECAVEEGHVE